MPKTAQPARRWANWTAGNLRVPAIRLPSPCGFTITHNDPLDFRNLPSASEELPRTPSALRPTVGCAEENFRSICEDESLDIRGPERPGKRDRLGLRARASSRTPQNFWGKFEQGNSLIFFYCNHGNPLDESINRILLGVGRISNIGPQLYFGKKLPKYPDNYPIWSRRITMISRIRGKGCLPRVPACRSRSYEHYLSCAGWGLLNFSYVAEHVSDDLAVGALERLRTRSRRSKTRGTPGGLGPASCWLNDALSEVWQNRGPFPGIGSVLQYLGFSRALISSPSLGPR